ncbi:MAG TPA: CHAT domain-containing protein [Kofleriaceae bacterium]|nr:CHAT domain-containing protein [Kofleriaceae bacterium]
MQPPKLVIRIERGRIYAEANDVADDAGPAGSVMYQRELTSEPLSRATIDAFMAWVEEKTPRLREAADYRLFGWHLWEFLFCGEIAEAFAMQMGVAKSTRTPMRLELSIDPADAAIACVPWEFLYSPPKGGVRDGYFLSTHTSLTLSRTSASTGVRGELRIREQPRVLIITSCPPGFKRVLWLPVVEAIAGAIAARLDGTGGPVTPCDPRSVAAQVQVVHDPRSAAALRDALAWKPHIVQFIGHGQQDGSLGKLAMLADEPMWLSGRQLIDLIDAAAPGHRPRLVVLHACEGARIAEQAGLLPRFGFGSVAPGLLAEGVPAVVAMQYDIDQTSAIDFSIKLYGDLLTNRPIHQAVQAARLNLMSLRGEVPRAFGTPVLYMAGGDGVLFEPPPPPVPRGPAIQRPASAPEAARVDAARPASAPGSETESAPFTAAGLDPRGAAQ